MELEWNKCYQDSSIKNEFGQNKSSQDSYININSFIDYSSPGVIQHQVNASRLEGIRDTKESCLSLYFVHTYSFTCGTFCYTKHTEYQSYSCQECRNLCQSSTEGKYRYCSNCLHNATHNSIFLMLRVSCVCIQKF